MGFVAFHTIAGVQGNIITPSLWALCVYEVIEQSQTRINLFIQKDVCAAVRTFKLVTVIFTTDTEIYFILIFFTWKNQLFRNFK